MTDRAANRSQLSLNQEFLCAMDQGETAGALSHWYTVTYGLRLTGDVDVGALQGALDDVVARHEILRTSLVREAERWYQEIDPPSPVNLLVRDQRAVTFRSRDLRAQQLLNDAEAGPFSVRDLPLLRAVLGRFGGNDSVLALTTHHIASDAWSMQLIIRDLAVFYAARRGHHPPELPDACQYRDFAAWQRRNSDSAAEVARRYWREKVRGGQIFTVPTDRVPPAGSADPYSVHRFLIDAELAATTAKFAKSMRSSLFIALLAAYNLLACQRTGTADLVVPTYTSGRSEARFRDAVGPFFNFLPIRTDITGCASFRDVVERTRASCLEAYANDIPFAHIEAEAGDLMRPPADGNLAVAAFEMLPPPALARGERAGDIMYAEIRDRRLSQPVGASTPNGMLWALDRLRSGEIFGTVRFSRDRFDEGTITALVAEYRRVLRASVTEPAARIPPP